MAVQPRAGISVILACATVVCLSSFRFQKPMVVSWQVIVSGRCMYTSILATCALKIMYSELHTDEAANVKGSSAVTPSCCERINRRGGVIPMPEGHHGSRQYSMEMEQEFVLSSDVPQ